MNVKLIVFSSVVTTLVGGMLGLAIAKMRPSPYTNIAIYQNFEQKYIIVGAITGLTIGASQEAIRQLKRQREEEENAAARAQEFFK